MYKLVKCIQQEFDDSLGRYSYSLYADNRVLEKVVIEFNGEIHFDETAKRLLTLATNIQLNYFNEFSERVSFLEMGQAEENFFNEVCFNENLNMLANSSSVFGKPEKPLEDRINVTMGSWDFVAFPKHKPTRKFSLSEEKLQDSLLLFTGGNESSLSKFLLQDVYPRINLQTMHYEEKDSESTNKFEIDHLVTSNFSIKRYLTAFKKPFNKSVVMFTYLPVLLIYATIIARQRGLKTLLVGDEWDRSVFEDDGFYGQAFDQSDFMKLCFQETLQGMGLDMQVGSVVANLNTTLIMNILHRSYPDKVKNIVSCFTPIRPLNQVVPCRHCSKCHRMSFILEALQLQPEKVDLPMYSSNWDYDAQTLFSSIGCQEEFETLNYLLEQQSKKPLGKAELHKNCLDLRDTPFQVNLPAKLEDYISKVSLANLKCILSL